MKAKILFFLIFFLSTAYALPGSWRGFVYINGSLATDGTVVELFLNNAQNAANSVAVGEIATWPDGYYLIHVEGTIGDNVTFKVNGVSIYGTNSDPQPWSIGFHPDETSYFNLTMNKTANGANCTYNSGCSSNNCASDYDGTGKWCAPENYCAHDNVTYANGASVCSDSSTKKRCVNSNWSSLACSSGCSGGSCLSPSGEATTTTVRAVTTTTIPTTTTVPATGETKTVQEIRANTSAIITFLKDDELAIQEIKIDVKNDVTGVSVTVKETTKPAEATLAIASDVGAVYKYLTIEKSNIDNEDISEVKIKFKVEKSWITANSINPDTITLKRLVSNSWTDLTTTKLSEDSTYYYYEATSTGFSVFAITGVKVAPACGNNIKEAGEECDGTDLGGQTCVSLGYKSGTLACSNCKLSKAGCSSVPDYTLLYLIIIAIIIVGFYLFIKGRGKKESHEKHLQHVFKEPF
jgi:PGF-pre-PGF domain-containing protein